MQNHIYFGLGNAVKGMHLKERLFNYFFLIFSSGVQELN